jgi:2-methylcitrate dehydratase
MEGPYEPFEGKNGLWEKANIDFIDPIVLEKQFIPFGITRTDFKFFPSQILTQAPTGLALELGEKLNVNDIKSIRIETYASCVSTPESHPEKWNPKTRESADHSIPFMVASALLYGEIGVNSFTRERIASEQIRSIISKLTIIENPSYTEKHPGQSNCKMQIELNDGQTSTSETSYPKGHSKNPLSDTELTDKFLNLTATVIKQEQAQKILSLIWEMETTKNLTELFDTLVI